MPAPLSVIPSKKPSVEFSAPSHHGSQQLLGIFALPGLLFVPLTLAWLSPCPGTLKGPSNSYSQPCFLPSPRRPSLAGPRVTHPELGQAAPTTMLPGLHKGLLPPSQPGVLPGLLLCSACLYYLFCLATPSRRP